MREYLFKRRQRMVRLLAVGNSLLVVVETLSKEFNCSKVAIYKDYENMHSWAHVISQDAQLTTILRARLEFLNREALNIVASVDASKPLTFKEQFLRIGAMNTALKITAEQIHIAQEIGLIERVPEVINTNVSVGMPYLASPEIRAAYVALNEAQKAEKEAQEKARSEKENASSKAAA